MEEQRSAVEQIGVTRVTADEIMERLDRGEPIVFIDVRNPQAWGESEEKIVGAIRIPADEVDEHLDEVPKGRSVVTYCT